MNKRDIGDIDRDIDIDGDIGAGIKGNSLVFFKQWKKDGEFQSSKPYPEFGIETVDVLILAINYLNKILIAKKK